MAERVSPGMLIFSIAAALATKPPQSNSPRVALSHFLLNFMPTPYRADRLNPNSVCARLVAPQSYHKHGRRALIALPGGIQFKATPMLEEAGYVEVEFTVHRSNLSYADDQSNHKKP